jgi:predicted methyltransferase
MRLTDGKALVPPIEQYFVALFLSQYTSGVSTKVSLAIDTMMDKKDLSLRHVIQTLRPLKNKNEGSVDSNENKVYKVDTQNNKKRKFSKTRALTCSRCGGKGHSGDSCSISKAKNAKGVVVKNHFAKMCKSNTKKDQSSMMAMSCGG